MAGRLIWLKWRLLVNGLKTDRSRRIGLPIVVAAILALAFFVGRAVLETARALPEGLVGTYSVWVAAIGTVAWATLPVIIFPVDESLDPAKFATLPIPPARLIGGLAGAALVTPPMLVPVILFSLNFVIFPSLQVAPFALVAYSLSILLVAVGGQAFTSAFSILVKSRRGRDLVMLVVVGMMAAVYVLQTLVARTVGELGRAEALSRYSLEPWAWLLAPAAPQRAVSEAAAGNYGLAVLFLLVGAGWLLALGVAWYRMLRRLLIRPETTATRAESRMKSFTVQPGWNAIGVIARKELRLYLRDPRMRMVWTGGVVFLAVLLGGLVLDAGPITLLRQNAWSVLIGPSVVLFIGLPVALNQFGWERRAVSFLFALPIPPSHLILGKNLATAIALTIETTVMTLVIAWISNGWRLLWYVPVILATAVSLQLAVGNVASVLTPLRLPDVGTDVFSQASEHGFLAIVAQFVSFMVIGAALTPVAVAFVLSVGYLENQWIAWVSIGSLLWGAGIYLLALWFSSRLFARRLPEVLRWVQLA